MCSVRHRPMPSAPNSRACLASSGVSAFVRTPRRRRLVGPFQNALEALVHLGRDQRHIVDRDRARRCRRCRCARPRARPSPPRGSRGLSRSTSSSDAPTTHGPSHPPGDQRGVAGLAALGGQDAVGGVEAGDVVGLGEGAHEDHVATLPGGLDRVPGREHDLAQRGAGRGRHAARQHGELGLRIEGRVQQRLQGGRVDRRQRLAPRSAAPPPRRRPRSAPPPGRGAWRCASGA